LEYNARTYSRSSEKTAKSSAPIKSAIKFEAIMASLRDFYNMFSIIKTERNMDKDVCKSEGLKLLWKITTNIG
jgi:hypothetical protein